MHLIRRIVNCLVRHLQIGLAFIKKMSAYETNGKNTNLIFVCLSIYTKLIFLLMFYLPLHYRKIQNDVYVWLIHVDLNLLIVS